MRAVHAPRQLSGRGLSYWTDGKGDDRVVYVTTGFRLVSLNAKTGVPVSGFGTNGVVDMKVGAIIGKGDQIDLETGEIGLHSTPTVTKDYIIVGSSFREGLTVKHHNNTKGFVRAYDAKTGKLVWQFNTIPQAGRVRQRHLGEGVVGDQRQHRRLDADHGRRGARHGLRAGRRRRPPTSTAAIARATTCSPRASSRSI